MTIPSLEVRLNPGGQCNVMNRFVRIGVLACFVVPATAVEFPGTPPGSATGRAEGEARILENQVLSASYLVQGNTLKLGQVSLVASDLLKYLPSAFQRFASGPT